MKIRTDFVTNSSSYSSAEVVIDNPVLMEILQRYKDMGTFDLDELHFSIGTYEGNQTKIPAFYLYEEECSSWRNAPEKIEDLLEEILEGIDTYCEEAISDAELYEQMKSELRERKNEITAGFQHVIWEWGESSNETEWSVGRVTTEVSYHYDRDKGEEYRFEVSAYDNEDERYKDGEIIEKRHLINGKSVE